MSLMKLRESSAPADSIRILKAEMRREDRRRLAAGGVLREQLNRELSIAGINPKPGRILFSTRGTASARVA